MQASLATGDDKSVSYRKGNQNVHLSSGWGHAAWTWECGRASVPVVVPFVPLVRQQGLFVLKSGTR